MYENFERVNSKANNNASYTAVQFTAFVIYYAQILGKYRGLHNMEQNKRV